MIIQKICGQGLEIFLQFYPMIPSRMVHLLSRGLILLLHYLFKHSWGIRLYLFLLKYDMVERFIFAEVGDSVPDIPNPIDLIDGLDVLGCDFMYGVWTIGLIPFVMSLLLVEAKLASLTELIIVTSTYLRLLLSVQLSRPRLERG